LNFKVFILRAVQIVVFWAVFYRWIPRERKAGLVQQ
jgi:hypothetical protein